MNKITLPWMDMIRTRMEEYVTKDPNGLIAEFLEPILKYGRDRETQLTNERDEIFGGGEEK